MESQDIHQKVTKILNDFFMLKFSLKGEDLIKAVDSFSWEPIQNITPDEFISVVKSHNDSNTPKENNFEAVSIVFPLDKEGKPHLSFDLLKASGCFPWEMDPLKIRYWQKVCNLHHVIVQLAQSSFYGCPKAGKNLRLIARPYTHLNADHPILDHKIETAYGYLDYRFPIHFDKQPEEDLTTGKYDLADMSKKEWRKLFQYFYEVESFGLVKPKEIPKMSFSVESKPPPYLKIVKTSFQVLVVGQISKDSLLWKLILKHIKIETETSNEIKGSIEIEKQTYKFHFLRVDSLPLKANSEIDGIVFADEQEEPEKFGDELRSTLKARAFFLYGTSTPNPCRAVSTTVYLSKKDFGIEIQDRQFLRFIHFLIEYQ